MASDADFYAHGRPENPQLPEDRPRGGGPKGPPPVHSTAWKVMAIAIAIIVLILVGILLFP
ncbi:hypothetical protein OIE62_30635 [Streptomyces scopuliridis]|uniref:Uncharacterized protein n=1 Tax=Streptomyces scopuliridis TaxID=452529 RepID=A0ACD4ZGR4_9ACTN|nr:hypothetical protein [Streptomyces scopuliridis]WSB33107.1 hypothetical protein OG949_09670 [Streptomyces scopuliridis]WSB97365.1 hypothetical protein OG835_10300 [Streptomyces scopuliridis]WSC08932.1 hypothetical protein OIE62_30635 [Streptomyces scopuliridis]